MRWLLILLLLLALPASSLETVWGQSSGGAFVSQDIDGDGLYEYARADTDWDGDGTTWKTCDCGGASGEAAAFNEDYICGFYRASATDATPTDYTAGDSAANPAACRFHGERVWDDITDDYTALMSQLAPGATIFAPAGIYPLNGAEATGVGADDCWNSSSGDWGTDDCPTIDGVSTSAIVLNKNGLTFTGSGSDPNGEKDLIRDGTYFVKNRGLRSDFVSGSPTALITRTFCVGFPTDNAGGGCGVGIRPDTGAAIELTYPQGQCIDQFSNAANPQTTGSPDGLCDTNRSWFASGGGTKGAANLSYQICVDNADSYADGLVVGSTVVVDSINVTGTKTRFWGRVDVQGAANSCNTSDRLISIAAVQGLRDVSDTEPHGTFVPFTIYGRSDGAGLEDGSVGSDAQSNITGPIPEDRIIGNLVVENLTVMHQDYAGSGSDSDGTEANSGTVTNDGTPDATEACEVGTEDACDNGVLIEIGAARNIHVRRIAMVHSNSSVGSGASLDFSAYGMAMYLEDSVLAHGVGGSLLDMSSHTTLKGNLIVDNAITTFEGQSGDFLIDNQGGFSRIVGNIFQRNYILGSSAAASGIVRISGPYVYVTGNTFISSSGPCLNVRSGTIWNIIKDNVFDCGSVSSAGVIRPSILFAGGGPTKERIDHVLVDSNIFSPNSAITSAGALGHMLFLGDATDTTNADDIGLGGIRITNNMMGGGMAAAFDSSAMLLLADDQDPDNARFYLANNTLEGSGGNDEQATRVAAQDSAASGQWHWLTTDNASTGTEGYLPQCGLNWLDGSASGDVAGSCNGVTFP